MNKRISESKAYAVLKDKLFKGTNHRIDRVENVMVDGTFDVNYCTGEGSEGWIELKAPIEPKRAITPLFGSNHKLSQEQKNWCLRQRQAGGKAFILIATDKRWLLIHGDDADFINEMTVPQLIEQSIWHREKPITGTESWRMLRICLTHY